MNGSVAALVGSLVGCPGFIHRRFMVKIALEKMPLYRWVDPGFSVDQQFDIDNVTVWHGKGIGLVTPSRTTFM